MQAQTLHTIGRACVVFIIFSLLFFLFRYMFHIIYPIAISFVLAALIHPLITFAYERYHIPRFISTSLILLGIISFIIWVIFFAITEIIQGTAYLAEKVPKNIHFFTAYVENIIQLYILPLYEKVTIIFSSLSSVHQENISQNIYGFLSEMTDVLTSFIQYILKSVPRILSIFPQSIAMIGFITIATFLLAIDFKTYINKLQSLLPKHIIKHSFHVGTHIKRTFSGYVQAQIKIVLLTCLMLYVGLTIIGVEHAFTIIVIAALVDFLPYIGTGIIFIPWILYTFLTSQFEFTIQLSVIYAIVVIVRQIIEPKMISAHLNIRPITTLFALFIGFQLWGVVGMLLAPITLIVVSGVYQAGTFHLIWKYITDT